MHQLKLSVHDTSILSPTEAVLVLPNGERRLTDIRDLETFAHLKRKIELEFGLPYELQNIQLTDYPNVISDWIPIRAIYQYNTEVHLSVDQRWTAFIRASLRGANEKVAILLEEKGGSVHFEKHLYIGVFVAVATGNEQLWRYLLDLKTNIYNRTASGRNLLHIAVHARNLDCIECILERTGFVLIDSKDKSDESPLDLANKICFVEAVEAFKTYREVSELNRNRMVRVYLDEKMGHQNEESNSTKNSQLCYIRANSTDKNSKAVSKSSSPSSRIMQTCQLLDREKTPNLLKSCATDPCTDNSMRLPGVSNEEFSNMESVVVPKISLLSVDAKCKPISRSAPVSPVPNPRITEVTELSSRMWSPLQKKNEDRSCRKNSDGNSNQRILDQRPLVMEQIVFLPTWKRGIQKNSEDPQHVETCENQLEVESEVGVKGQKSTRGPAVRSRSVATITPEELHSIADNTRLKKPWNDWRRISLVTRNERDILIRQMGARAGERKKSFERWLAEKERSREELTSKATEEEQMKRVQREKLEDERKLRCKSYGRWLAEKEIEAEKLREAEKKREIEKKNLDEKQQMRKMEAERKYEKWMREKYDEELKKEEELHRLMEEKWKIKNETRLRRKSAPAKSTGVEQKSLKTKSLPVL